jgi:hypothetical protein
LLGSKTEEAARPSLMCSTRMSIAGEFGNDLNK